MSKSSPAPTPLLPFKPRRSIAGAPWLRSSDGQRRRLVGVCTVGSAPDNDWALPDPHISAHHLVLVAEGDRVLVTDRGSTNGTFLNGARVREAELPEGGCLQLGTTLLHRLRPDLPRGAMASMLGESAGMARLRQQIQGLHEKLKLPILVLGESGTGKELVAAALHEQSGRSGAFVAVNCGSLPRDLIESELFGHERGAFTGAARQREGCIREAHGGTLFLDEIGEMPLELQPRLLRALEVRAVRPVGGDREIEVDVRVVAATHRDLPAEIAAGRFREDLYYRLAGVVLRVPPLRERPGDVALLLRHFLAEHAAELGPRYLGDEELARLVAYPWPGNVRQLLNALGSAVHLAGPVLRAEDLLERAPAPRPLTPPGPRPYQRPAPDPSEAADAQGPAAPARRMAEIERDAYLAALKQTGNNRRAAAALLGIPKSTLCDKLKRLGIT